MTLSPNDEIIWRHKEYGRQRAKVLEINEQNRRPIKILPVNASNARPKWIGRKAIIRVITAARRAA